MTCADAVIKLLLLTKLHMTPLVYDLVVFYTGICYTCYELETDMTLTITFSQMSNNTGGVTRKAKMNWSDWMVIHTQELWEFMMYPKHGILEKLHGCLISAYDSKTGKFSTFSYLYTVFDSLHDCANWVHSITITGVYPCFHSTHYH